MGLKVLVENIEDQHNNITRFAVIAERGEQPTGRDKTTMILRLSNQAGTLAKAIAPFEKNGVNMTWIESFPTAENASVLNPSYLFFADIDGHVEDEAGQADAGTGPQAVRPAGDPRVLSEKRERRELMRWDHHPLRRSPDGLQRFRLEDRGLEPLELVEERDRFEAIRETSSPIEPSPASSSNGCKKLVRSPWG